MSQIRFNHVFLTFVFGTGLCAFVIPPEYTNSMRGKADGLFAPVAFPIRRAAQAVANRTGSDHKPLPGNAALTADIRAELDRLRAENNSLFVQVERLRQINANRDLAGRVRDYATPFKVLGSDARASSLSLVGSASDGVQPGMAVVSSDALVGRVTASGVGGIQVQLVTHPQFRANAAFYRYDQAKDGVAPALRKVETPPPLVEGRNGGRMVVTNLTIQQANDAKLAPGDLVLLDERDDWSLAVTGQMELINGQPLGVIEKIETQTKMPLFAEITIRPQVNLTRLGEVMVVTGKPANKKAAVNTAKATDARSTPVGAASGTAGSPAVKPKPDQTAQSPQQPQRKTETRIASTTPRSAPRSASTPTRAPKKPTVQPVVYTPRKTY